MRPRGGLELGMIMTGAAKLVAVEGAGRTGRLSKVGMYASHYDEGAHCSGDTISYERLVANAAQTH